MSLTPRLVVLAALLGAGTAFGWYTPVLWNVCNSAAGPGGSIVVNADCIDSVMPSLDDVALRVFYSTDDQATWQEVPMNAVGRPGYDSTFQCAFPAPDSGTVFYYVRADNGTNFGTQSPLNSGDAWPVTDNLLAELAVEGTGDTINDPRGEWLDLTSAAMSYSGGKFYGRLTNRTTSNSWPLNSGLFGPWYLYTVGFRNSEAYTRDTLVYAMTYANVLGIYTSGLYEINALTHDFTKIAGIETQTSGNRLVMRCNISDLAARRGFQPWPNQCGYLTAAKGETRSANASLESWQHDTTNSSRFYVDRTPCLVVGQNQPPGLNLAGVEPDTGTSETNFRFYVHYADADTNLPVLHSVVVDADTFDLAPGGHRYAAGVNFATTRRGFEAGPHEYRFVFDDGSSVVTTPPDTFFVIGAAVAEVPQGGPVGFSATPNPFSGRVRLTFPKLARAVELLDPAGRRIRSFNVSGEVWDGRDQGGVQLPAGVYYLREQGGPLRRLLVKVGR